MALFDEDTDEFHDDRFAGGAFHVPVRVAGPALSHPPITTVPSGGLSLDDVSLTGPSQELASNSVYVDEGAVSASIYPFPLSSSADSDSFAASRETPCSFLTGAAGTGKSFTLRKRLEADPSYAMLSAVTGIASVNLGCTTIHSLLGFFDEDSLRDAYLSGVAQRKLRRVIGDGYKNVVIDEISMLSSTMLDLIVKVFDDVNQNLAPTEPPIGLVLTGDFAQLPAIPDQRKKVGRARVPTPWAFDANSWPRFAQNTTRLTRVWRQADERYLAILNYARSGNGAAAANLLASAGVQFHNAVDIEFDGTTLVSKNEEVDRYNQLALDRVKGRLMALPARRWGKLRSEWKNIPDRTILREGAYVMILSNRYDAHGELLYVNGDCGHVTGIQPSTVPGLPPSILVELVRTGQVVPVESIVRAVEHKERPDDMSGEVTISSADDFGRYLGRPHYRGKARRFVSGQIEYFPLRLAYASTVHKVQGLSLDRVQIDFRSWAMQGPAMGYVALSRCRTLEGLRLVGLREAVAAKCNVDPRVREWL